MNINEIEQVMTLFSRNNLTYLEVDSEGVHICLKKESVAMSNSAPALNHANVAASVDDMQSLQQHMQIGTPVKAPMVGVFYTSPSPESQPFVKVGDSVKEGDVIGLIEAMKMMNEIKAPVSGILSSIEVENEELVSFDDNLFMIEEVC